MNRFRLVSGIILILISYYFFILSLMNVFPKWIAAPLLFVSLVFTLAPISKKKRFKGFH
ncbi:hypothetical protein JCM9140_1293 [Halalkalibacter wakoensis JCM 9140]|uniref:Uncharacterized protein n=1 Tax=Halalkalibacter wakoensis JCM 9140 TaxID=1236970 RepID=W4PZN3_9BACI|nr:hypothetical protein [Halalkalibacter wakoensis]GAE25306.1 hypothetical protein JCM9140_1293 [Halalkalibacter wakoensis JCM 9140]